MSTQNSIDYVLIFEGAGTDAKKVILDQEEASLKDVLSEADITIKDGYTPTLGYARITDINTAKVRRGDMIIIAPMPSNG